MASDKVKSWSAVVRGGRWFVVVGVVGVLATAAGCQRSTTSTSTEPPASVSVAELSSPYAPKDGVETPYQPSAARLRPPHLFARHVRHRHAGPR